MKYKAFDIFRKYIKLDQTGFTLVELVIIIVILGIIATVAIPKFSNMSESAKITATKVELDNIKKAILGSTTEQVMRNATVPILLVK